MPACPSRRAQPMSSPAPRDSRMCAASSPSGTRHAVALRSRPMTSARSPARSHTPRRHCWWLDGEIVGALIAAWDGWRGNMYRLAMLPHLRRQGIATRLVDAEHEHLRSKGARRVTALVAHEEEDAVRLWKAAGYHRDEQIARFVRNL